jgi:PAS domain S-box-containing protein
MNEQVIENHINDWFFETSPEPILILEKGIIQAANPAAQQFFGLNTQELVGKPAALFSPEYQPDGRASLAVSKELVRKALTTGKPQVAFWQYQLSDNVIKSTQLTLYAALQHKTRTVIVCRIRSVDETENQFPKAGLLLTGAINANGEIAMKTQALMSSALLEALRIARLLPWRFDFKTDELIIDTQIFPDTEIAAALKSISTDPEAAELRIALNKYIEVAVHPEDQAAFRAFFDAGTCPTQAGAIRFFSYRRIRPDGKIDFYEIRVRYIVDFSGQQVIGAVGTTQIVTEQKEKELALAASNQRLQELENQLWAGKLRLQEALTIAQLVPWKYEYQMGTYQIELAHFLDPNARQMLTQLGEVRNDVLHLSLQKYAEQFIAPENRQSFLSFFEPDPLESEAALEKEKTMIFEKRYANGRSDWLQVRAHYLLDDNHKPFGLYGTLQNITELKQKSIAIQEALERFDLITLAGGEGLWDLVVRPGGSPSDPDQPVWYSDKLLSILGYEKAEFPFVAASWHNSIHPNDVLIAMGELPPVLEPHSKHRRQAEYRVRHKAGHYIWVSAATVAVVDAHGNISRLAGSVRDITERKESEMQLRETTERLESAMKLSQLGWFELDTEKNLMYFDAHIAENTRISRHSETGQYIAPPEAIMAKMDEAGRKAMAESIRQFKANQDPDWQYQFEFAMMTPDNNELHYFITLVIRKPGAPHIAIGTTQDITLRKLQELQLKEANEELIAREEELRQQNEELEATQEEMKRVQLMLAQQNEELAAAIENLKTTQQSLINAEKLASLGQLVAGVAHEINTPVGVAVTAASHLETTTHDFQMKVAGGKLTRSELANFLEEAKNSSDLILKNLTRAADLIKNFKKVAVDQTADTRTVFNLKTNIHEIITSLRPTLKQTKIHVILTGDDDIEMHSMPGALSQIIINFVTNALTHAFENQTEGKIEIHVSKRSDTQARIEFADNGKGIAPENLPKIFDPFFTTRRGAGGSGLGLNIVHNLVTQRLGGTIRCESALGTGTKFIIDIPLSYEKSKAI